MGPAAAADYVGEERDVFMDAIADAVAKRDEAIVLKAQKYRATTVDTSTHRSVPYSQRGIPGSSTDFRGLIGGVATALAPAKKRPTARIAASKRPSGIGDTSPKRKAAKATPKAKAKAAALLAINTPIPASPKAIAAPKAKAKAKAKAAPKAKAAASSSASASASASAAEPASVPVKKTIKKATNITKPQAPSTMGIQLLREYFEDGHNKGKIPKTVFEEYTALFAKWKSGGDKKATLKLMQQLYKTIYK